MSTKQTLLGLTRPVRAVTLPSGGQVHVRALSLAELREVRGKGGIGDDSDEERGLWLCAYALAEPDGGASFPSPTSVERDYLLTLTPADLDAIADAAAEVNSPNKADAKKS